jgi:integrase
MSQNWRSYVIVFLTVRKLLDVARGHYMEALFNLALATGLRRGELLALKWQDINFVTGTLQVRRILTRVPTKLPGKGFERPSRKHRRADVV